jgi:hypothetical protein
MYFSNLVVHYVSWGPSIVSTNEGITRKYWSFFIASRIIASSEISSNRKKKLKKMEECPSD